MNLFYLWSNTWIFSWEKENKWGFSPDICSWYVAGDSTRLITGSADQSVKLWDVQTGTQLYSFNFNSPARSVDFSVGDKLVVITTDPFMGNPSTIQVKRIARDPSDRKFQWIHSHTLTISIESCAALLMLFLHPIILFALLNKFEMIVFG
jgi:WD40 repeat protein